MSAVNVNLGPAISYSKRTASRNKVMNPSSFGVNFTRTPPEKYCLGSCLSVFHPGDEIHQPAAKPQKLPESVRKAAFPKYQPLTRRYRRRIISRITIILLFNLLQLLQTIFNKVWHRNPRASGVFNYRNSLIRQ